MLLHVGDIVKMRKPHPCGNDLWRITYVGADIKMRCEKSKLTTVRALQSCGFETIAAGDSFNDLAMIEASKAGFLFRSTDSIKADYPQFPAYDEFDDLLGAIKKAL